MINKDKYYSELEEYKRYKNINEKDFQLLYAAADNQAEVENATKLTDNILESLFSMPAYPELLIPLKFWDTEIGKAILAVRYSVDNSNYYVITDIINMTGYTKQNINLDIKSGKLKGEKRGKFWMFKEKDVNEYLAIKGITTKNHNSVIYAEPEESFISHDIKEGEYKS